MATKTSVIITDDLDGSANAQTVTFSIDGATYEIDLAKKNRAKLERQMAPYVEAARRVSRRSAGTRTRGQRSARSDRAGIRVWAKEQGFKVSERGRISADIVAQYEAAHS